MSLTETVERLEADLAQLRHVLRQRGIEPPPDDRADDHPPGEAAEPGEQVGEA
jgi:predicted HTH domain antitoxin